MKTDLPVYLITGFLEAGKTKFIQEMLADKEFNTGEKTLLLVCEEGIEEYEPELFYGQNVQIEVLESEEELTADNLAKLLKKHPYERLIVEYNGMWPLNRLYDALPDGAFLNDQIMLPHSFGSFFYIVLSAIIFLLCSQNRESLHPQFAGKVHCSFRRSEGICGFCIV